MGLLRVYYKVYQDKESMDGSFYVETKEGVEKSLPYWIDENNDGGCMPVLEPTVMTVEDFENLPEFQGF